MTTKHVRPIVLLLLFLVMLLSLQFWGERHISSTFLTAMVRYMHDDYNLDIRFDSDLALHFYPNPTLKLKSVLMQDAKTKRDIAFLKNLDIGFEWMGFSKVRPTIDHMIIQGVTVHTQGVMTIDRLGLIFGQIGQHVLPTKPHHIKIAPRMQMILKDVFLDQGQHAPQILAQTFSLHFHGVDQPIHLKAHGQVKHWIHQPLTYAFKALVQKNNHQWIVNNTQITLRIPQWFEQATAVLKCKADMVIHPSSWQINALLVHVGEAMFKGNMVIKPNDQDDHHWQFSSINMTMMPLDIHHFLGLLGLSYLPVNPDGFHDVSAQLQWDRRRDKIINIDVDGQHILSQASKGKFLRTWFIDHLALAHVFPPLWKVNDDNQNIWYTFGQRWHLAHWFNRWLDRRQDVNLKLKHMDIYGLKAEKVQMNLRLDPEALSVDSSSFSAAQGQWQGRANLRFDRGFPISIHATVESADVAKILALWHVDKPYLTGQMLANAQVYYHATLPGKPTWHGQVQGEIDQGQWHGIDGPSWLVAKPNIEFGMEKILDYDGLSWQLKIKQGRILIDPITIFVDQQQLLATLVIDQDNGNIHGCLGQMPSDEAPVDDIIVKGKWPEFVYKQAHGGCQIPVHRP